MRCPRCSVAVPVDQLIQLIDTPTGLLAVTTRPVATHLHECLCGQFQLTVASATSSSTVHPAQLTLIQGHAA